MANSLSLRPNDLCALAERGSGVTISSMCTVFAESEVISLIGMRIHSTSTGRKIKANGLYFSAQSICRCYWCRTVRCKLAKIDYQKENCL